MLLDFQVKSMQQAPSSYNGHFWSLAHAIVTKDIVTKYFELLVLPKYSTEAATQLLKCV